jgi:hypothetical protein
VKDRLKVQLVKVNDTITINAVCDSDTIISVVEVPYEKIVYVEKETALDKVKPALYILLIITFVSVISRFSRR